MVLGHDLKGRRIVLAGACQAPGPAIAQQLADIGARVVALDENSAGLQKITHSCSARVEPLALSGDVPQTLRRIGETWGRSVLHGVINLMPLQHPRDINGQIRVQTALTRGFARALVAGQGAMVSVVAVPHERLDGLALGLAPALSAVVEATAAELASHKVRFNTVIVPQAAPEIAIAATFALLSQQAAHVTGQKIRLGSA